MNPGDVVPLSFNGGLVALSFLTAVLGSYVALLAAVGIRTETQDGDIRLGYILIGAVAMGGVGIWSMHFIGMQAQDLPFLVGYQVGLTVLSFLVAAGFSGWAFWYVGRDRFTIGRCLVGGLAAGLGVAAMHYVGISAMRMPAVFLWNLPLVVLSVLIAVIAASAALWLAFNTQNELQRAGAAVLMAVAVWHALHRARRARWCAPRRATEPACRSAACCFLYCLRAVGRGAGAHALAPAAGLQPFSRSPGAAHRRHHRSAPAVEPGRTHGPTVGPG